MNHQNISDIYEANDKIRAKFKELIGSLSDEQLNSLPEGEKWTIAQFVEHVATVEYGIVRICTKLLNKAKELGETSDGSAKISAEFMQNFATGGSRKFEAPESVHPTGTRTIAESFAKMEENRQKLEELRPLFESVAETGLKFPHPAFGEMTSHEWLLLIGGHEGKHIAQIKKILARM